MGVFVVEDDYDFDYHRDEAVRAVSDYVAGKPEDGGFYDGSRSLGGQLKTIIMSRVPGKKFAVTSDPIHFRQDWHAKRHEERARIFLDESPRSLP